MIANWVAIHSLQTHSKAFNKKKNTVVNQSYPFWHRSSKYTCPTVHIYMCDQVRQGQSTIIQLMVYSSTISHYIPCETCDLVKKIKLQNLQVRRKQPRKEHTKINAHIYIYIFNAQITRFFLFLRTQHTICTYICWGNQECTNRCADGRGGRHVPYLSSWCCWGFFDSITKTQKNNAWQK